MRLLLIHIIFFLMASTFVAQTGSLVTDANKIEIGDQIGVSVRFTFDANVNPADITYPKIEADQSINESIDIIYAEEPNTESSTDNQGNPQIIWQQNFVIGIYSGGNVQLGPFKAVLGADTISTNVTTIQVALPELQEDKGFVGIKDISTDPYTFWEKVMIWIKKHWIAILVVILLIIGAILTAIYVNKKPEEKVVKGPIVPLPLQWMKQLEEIENQQLWQNGKHKEYYIEVTGVIRKFIEYKYNIKALEQTSHEIIDSLRLSSIDPAMMTRIQNLFALADLIKFAKSLPTSKENEEAMSIAKSILSAEISQLNIKSGK